MSIESGESASASPQFLERPLEQELTPQAEAALDNLAKELVASVDMKVFQANENVDKLKAIVYDDIIEKYKSGYMSDQGFESDFRIGGPGAFKSEIRMSLKPNPQEGGGYALGFAFNNDKAPSSYHLIHHKEIIDKVEEENAN